MNSRIRRFLNVSLIFIFFSHGLLYFIFPQDIYNESSFIKIIKYFVIGFFFLLNIDQIKGEKVRKFFLLTLGLFFLIFLAHSPGESLSNEGLKRAMLYSAPLFIIVIAPIIDKLNLNKVTITVIVIAILAALAEYYFFRGLFTRYDFSEKGGFVRVVSIFVNPNNAGLIFSLSFIYIYENLLVSNFKTYLYKMIFLTFLGFAIYLTGSKTPIVIVILYLIIRFVADFFKTNKKTDGTLVYSMLLFTIGVTFFLLSEPSILNSKAPESRDFSLNTATIRQLQFLDFFNFSPKNDFIAPNYYSLQQTYDIMFLQLWSDLSIIGLVASLICLIVLYFKRIQYYSLGSKLSILLLLLSGFSLSFLIIWPTAYVFWYLIFSDNFYKKAG